MKKTFFIKTISALACLSMLMTSCGSNPVVGPQGEQGTQGTQGPKGDKGDPGENGVSIVSIKLTSSEGKVDTYTITYSDGKTSTFTVTNGNDGQSIKGDRGDDGHTPEIKIGTNGNWIIDGADTGIQAQGPKGEKGNDGVSIVSIEKTGTSGLKDTYTITYSDGNTSTFEVTNGEQGIQGIQGVKGDDGHTPSITINEEGNWVVDGQDTGIKAQGEKGPKGDQGEKGDQGVQGKSAYELYVEQYPGYTWGQEQWIRDLALGKLAVTISFDSKGGSEIAPITACKGEEISISQIPTKSHATFAGWFFDDSYETEITYTFVAVESQEFIVKWNYDSATVTYMSGDSIFHVDETAFYSRTTAPETNPTAALGYKFIGWKKEGETDLWDFNRFVMEENLILNAAFDYDFLEIPAVIINVDDGTDIVSKEEYKSSKISVMNTEEDWEMDEVAADVKGRGNSTWTLAKKPYRIKFNKKQSMLGSEYKAKSWTLIANHSDKTLSRNYIAYELGKQFDDIAFSSFHKFVDVYLNGEYKGVYLLCDQMQVGEGRVEIDESIAEDGNNGYLLELDFRAKNEGALNQDYFMLNDIPYAIKSPDTETEAFLANKDNEINYISDYITNAYNAITASATIEELGAWIDVNSFADSYLIDELFANNDCGYSSCYFYKDKNGVLFKGPIWDFDIGAGNVNYTFGNTEDCPFDTRLYASVANVWYKKLVKNSGFVELLKEKIINYEEVIDDTVALLDTSSNNSLFSLNRSALERNFQRWNIMGSYVWPEPVSVYNLATVKEQFDYLRDWLEGRFVFIKDTYGIETAVTIDAYQATFDYDDGIDAIRVFENSNYEQTGVLSDIAYSRDSSTGEYLKDGNGQVNFEIIFKEGFELDSISVDGTYKNLKTPADTGRVNTYRITKIASDLSVAISSKAIS